MNAATQQPVTMESTAMAPSIPDAGMVRIIAAWWGMGAVKNAHAILNPTARAVFVLS